jgi:CheY-like chemotaxis protein
MSVPVGENSSRTQADRPCVPGEHACGADPEHGSVLPLRVLIADDFADAADSLAMLLSNAGVETEIALDGEQALARASRWRPHICVLDLEMPKLGGCEIARRIREQNWIERPLLIALTGWTAAQDRRSALEAGFDQYVTKPVEPVKLMRIIQDYLVRRPR